MHNKLILGSGWQLSYPRASKKKIIVVSKTGFKVRKVLYNFRFFSPCVVKVRNKPSQFYNVGPSEPWARVGLGCYGPHDFGRSVNLTYINQGGHIMPTTLLLAPPLRIFRPSYILSKTGS